MRKYQRKKLNKILLISAIVLAIIAIIVGIIVYFQIKAKQEEIFYEDTVTASNLFKEITVDFTEGEVERDGTETTLKNEFGIDESQENTLLNSQEELINYFADSTFEVEIKENVAYITNVYQTKKIILNAESVEDEFKAINVTQLHDGLYLLEYDTQKRTRAAFEYFVTAEWVQDVELDQVLIIDTINDESQTVYGSTEETEETQNKTYGIGAMGLENYKNIINENGNPSEVVVATIGYGAQIDNEFFSGRISENYYNFIEESTNIYETIPQGSRILEVIKDATTDNVKLLPLVVVDYEGYTTVATILRAIEYATENSDVICYELVNDNNDMINLALENAFKENVPVSCVTTIADDETTSSNENESGVSSTTSENENDIYPANNATTIAVSSIDKNSELTTYSGQGEYIDFAAYSTDVEEIFDSSSSVSRWSGSQYSNSHIVSLIALIKTYHKEYTILEIYNVLRNYCVDLGEEGKDELYGYGVPNFSEITIADIDKVAPEIQEVKYDNEIWETSKQIQIIATDNIKIAGWAITTSEGQPEEWNELEEITPNLDVTETVTENSKYYIWVKDSAGNVSGAQIEINKVDTTAPTINYEIDDSTLDENDYVTITVNAEDTESGLNETPYSWDGENWTADGSILKVTENGRYKVYVRDALENVSEKEIKVESFPIEGIAEISEGTIIKSIVVSTSWNGDTNDSVRITFNSGLNMTGWQITTSEDVPDDFEEIEEDEEDEDSSDDENFSNNTTSNSSTDNTISNSTSNNSVTNTTSEETEEVQGYNYSLTVTKSLKTGVTYYAWIIDTDGNVTYQTFTISKVEI